MPRKLTTIMTVALLAAAPMLAHAGGQLGGRVGGAVGGTVGGAGGIGVGGAQAGVNGSGAAGLDDQTRMNKRRLHSDTTAAGRADARAGARVTTPSAGASVGAQTPGGAAGAQATVPSAGVSAGGQASGGASTTNRVEGSGR